MKKLILAAALSALSLNAFAAPAVEKGTVHFRGVVKASTCSIVVDDQNQTVNLNTVESNVLRAAGSNAAAVDFDIKLENCPIVKNVQGNDKAAVTLAFDNQYSKVRDDGLLSNGTAVNDAKNVQVRIAREDGQVIDLKKDADEQGILSQEFETSTNGEHTFKFKANLHSAEGLARPGSVFTEIPFRVVYK